MARLEEIQEQLRAVAHRLHQQRRQERAAKTRYMEEEIETAWRSRKLALAMRLSREAGRCRFGPKKRDGRAVRVAQPTREEWLTAWRQAGKDGGTSATEVATPELIGSTDALPDLTVEMGERARADIRRVSRAVRRAGRRRAVPDRPPPVELWQFCFHPDKRYVRGRWGVGADAGIPDMACFAEAMLGGFRMIRQASRTPSHWHHSTAVGLRKSGAPGVKGKRVVHVLDPVGKCLYADVLEVPADVGDYGFIKHRRQEGAMMAVSLKDMSNAFASGFHSELDATVDLHVASELAVPPAQTSEFLKWMRMSDEILQEEWKEWWLDVILLARWCGDFVDLMGLGSFTPWFLRVASLAEFAGSNTPIRIISVAIWFKICHARCYRSDLAPSRPVGVSSSMALEGTPSWLALPTAETNGAPPHRKGRSDDDRGSGGTRGLRETAKTMRRLVLADPREIQELAAVAFKKFETKKGGLSEQQEATGKAHDAQSNALREKAKNGEQVDYESRGPPHVAIFAASVKWWGTQGNLAKQELTEGFASLWKDVIMRFTPQQGKPNKGKGKSSSDDMQEDAKGTDKGMIMHAVELSRMNGPKLSTLLAEAMADMKAQADAPVDRWGGVAERAWRLEKRQAFGACVAQLRGRVTEGGEYGDFLSKTDMEKLASVLSQAEVWLSDHPDATRAEYTDKLEELKKAGDAAARRLLEAREKCIEDFEATVEGYRSVAQTPGDRFAHIAPKRLAEVADLCARLEAWLAQAKREATPGPRGPALSRFGLERRRRHLAQVAGEVLGEPGPAAARAAPLAGGAGRRPVPTGTSLLDQLEQPDAPAPRASWSGRLQQPRRSLPPRPARPAAPARPPPAERARGAEAAPEGGRSAEAAVPPVSPPPSPPLPPAASPPAEGPEAEAEAELPAEAAVPPASPPPSPAPAPAASPQAEQAEAAAEGEGPAEAAAPGAELAAEAPRPSPAAQPPPLEQSPLPAGPPALAGPLGRQAPPLRSGISRAELLAQRERLQAMQQRQQQLLLEGRVMGEVLTWDSSTGVGMVACPEVTAQHGKDVYVHRRSTNLMLEPGDMISFRAHVHRAAPGEEQVCAQSVVKHQALTLQRAEVRRLEQLCLAEPLGQHPRRQPQPQSQQEPPAAAAIEAAAAFEAAA
ncbi:unnamed protein product, partial [Prorocentrum cordatum]